MRISDWSSDVCSSDLAKVGLSLLQLRLGDAVVQLHQHLSLGDLAALVEINGRNAPGDFRAQYDGVFRPQTAHGGHAARHGQLMHRRHFDRDGLFCRSEEHTSELQSLMRISYAVFCLKKKKE